jgi:hypothetical protein
MMMMKMLLLTVIIMLMIMMLLLIMLTATATAMKYLHEGLVSETVPNVGAELSVSQLPSSGLVC